VKLVKLESIEKSGINDAWEYGKTLRTPVKT
jgi:hypothetical protein